MKFVLVDRISAFEPGRRAVAHKSLSLAEEYLADHFPTFPVLPGVLMLEAMVQASAWVVRAALDFRPGLVLLKEARNVTYKSFVAPGETLTVETTCRTLAPEQSEFVAEGRVGDRPTVKGKFTLRHLRLTDVDEQLSETQTQLAAQQRALLARLLQRGAAESAAWSSAN